MMTFDHLHKRVIQGLMGLLFELPVCFSGKQTPSKTEQVISCVSCAPFSRVVKLEMTELLFRKVVTIEHPFTLLPISASYNVQPLFNFEASC